MSVLFEKLEPVIHIRPIIFPERKGSVLSSANAPGFPPHKIKKPDLCSNVAFALHPNTKHHEEKKLGVGRQHVYKDMNIHPTVLAESKIKV